VGLYPGPCRTNGHEDLAYLWSVSHFRRGRALHAACFNDLLHRPVPTRTSQALEEESLGTQTRNGLRVEGTRVRGLLPAALGRGETSDERWTSPELKLEVYARSEDDEIGVVEYRLTTISRAEPQPEFFEVPADYVKVQYQGAASLNPYAFLKELERRT
jgi:hypothetical protein